MKRPGIALLLRILVVTAALALSRVSLPQSAFAGWTWDEMTAAPTWTDDASPPAGFGWTWDEGAQPGDVDPGTDGWTWDEQAATGTDPAPAPAQSEQPAP